MSIVNLVSGGLDSTLIGVLLKEEGVVQFPLFIDYGQKSSKKEWQTCQAVHHTLELPEPQRMDLSGYGSVILSGLTSDKHDVKADAFTPGRNLMFLVMASAYAHQVRASGIAIGLLSEEFSIFPDQKLSFINNTEKTIELALGRSIKIVTPLFDLRKIDVVKLAKRKGVSGTYSCHLGEDEPCGKCIACLEYCFKEVE